MPFRIEVNSKIPDARSVSKCGFFNSLIADKSARYKIKRVEIMDAYTIDKKLNADDAKRAAELLTNPLIENYQILNHPLLTSSPSAGEEKKKFPSLEGRGKGRVNFDFAIEISFLPGVTDNVGNTAKETIEDGLKIKFEAGENVYSSQIFFITLNNKNIPPKSPLTLRGESKKVPPLKIRGGEGGDIQKIAASLHNPLIQKATIKSFKEYFTPPYPPLKKGGEGGGVGMGLNLPKVKLSQNQKAITVDLNIYDEELSRLGKLGILDPKTKQRRGPLALDLNQLKTIRTYFHKKGKRPTDVELESLAQTWSEHCKHTIFADPLDEIKDGIYRHYIKRATNIIRAKSKAKPRGDICVSVFNDNSGAIVFDKDYLITHKVETHNTPSSLDPFGGAITGIVGVNRDCLGFGLGAKPIINTYGFCLAPPDDQTMLYRDQNKKNPMLSARRILEGVVAGINAGGNQSGIPTNDGFVYFDKRYRGKPLVFAGTVGLIPRKIKNRESHVKYPKSGDLIVMLGGRVGLDGIHGATFSSESLDAHSPATAVQIGDPITQKKFSDAIVREARGQNLFSSITDCGAGGLSSAVGEMAKMTDGCEVLLHKVPVKYPGLAPWQIWISESQERMVLAVPPKNWKKFERLTKMRGVEAAVIGKFTQSGRCVVKHKNQTVMDIDLEFLHEGRPIKYQVSSIKYQANSPQPPLKIRGGEGDDINLKSNILNLLKRPSIASTEFVAMQYDHEVQGSSVTKPLQGKGRVNSSATVTRPVLTSQKGVVLAHGLYPSYSDIDAYRMAAASIDSAVKAAVCAGANLNHLAILDNFCWYSGNEPESLHKLKMAAKACFDIATAFGTPFISGKDSMYNDFKGFDENGRPVKISIPPTLLISAISVTDDVSKAVTIDAKLPGGIIYILGETKNELGGSEYLQMLFSLPSPEAQEGSRFTPYRSRWTSERLVLGERSILYGAIPKVDAKKNLKLYQALQSAIENGLIASAIPVSHGGLAAALMKMAVAGQLGAIVDINGLPGNWKTETDALFSESQGRILVTVNPKNAAKFQKLMKGIKHTMIGEVSDDGVIRIKNREQELAVIQLSEATKAYHQTFLNL